MGPVPTITENKIWPVILTLSLSLKPINYGNNFLLQISVFEKPTTALEISISNSKNICSWFEISIWNRDISIYTETTPFIE